MAAAVIPIIAAAAPLLQPLISSLVMHVEHIFGHKTGPTKFDNVLTAVLKTASDLATAGKIPGQLDPSSIATMIESVVQDLKARGVLNPETAASVVQAQSNTASIPQSLTLKVLSGSLQLGQ